MKFNFTIKDTSKTIGIRVSKDNYNYIKNLAEQHGQTIGGITQVFVEAAISDHKALK